MKKRGRGVASMMYSVAITIDKNPSGAVVRVNTDGTVTVIAGTAEIGQGSSTVMCQIAAEELGVSFNNVEIITADTETTPPSACTCASRVTFVDGNAVRIAANAAKKMLFEIAAEKLNADPDSLESRDGYIYVKGSPDVRMSVGEAATISQWGKGKPILASGAYNPPNTDLDPETGQGNPFPTYCYATQIVDVEVDTETGEVKVLKVYAAHDVGKAINPGLALGQIYGGVIMGLSYALMEEMKIDAKGRVLNPNFGGYFIASMEDTPQIEPIIVEKYEPMGPFGAKSLGEPPHICMAPAIINAIYDAVGVRIDSLPVTPEKVLNALREKSKQKAKPEAKPPAKKRRKAKAKAAR